MMLNLVKWTNLSEEEKYAEWSAYVERILARDHVRPHYLAYPVWVGLMDHALKDDG